MTHDFSDCLNVLKEALARLPEPESAIMRKHILSVLSGKPGLEDWQLEQFSKKIKKR